MEPDHHKLPVRCRPIHHFRTCRLILRHIYLVVFLLSIGISTTSGGLVNSPSDQNVTVGERVTFFCKTNLDLPVYWYLNHTHEIFYGGRVSMSYKDVYEVDSTNKGEYNLIIASANESNNGEYTCGDDEGQGEKKSARLHVTGMCITLMQLIVS